MKNRFLVIWLLVLVGTISTSLSAQIFTNSSAIEIPANSGTNTGPGASTPYPSTVAVAGLGAPSSVTATVTGLSHGWMGDVTILLQSPNGNTIVLYSDFGAQASVTSVTYVFSDGAGSQMTQAVGNPSGAYKPTDYNTGYSLASPAPQRPYASTTMASLLTTTFNGNWNLYIDDNRAQDIGALASWSLTFVDPPVAPTITSTAITTATVGTSYNYIVSATGIPAPTLSISPTPTGWLTWNGTNRLTGSPTAGDVGTSPSYTITATSSSGNDTQVFTITVSLPNPEIDVQRPINTSRPSGSTDIITTPNSALTAMTPLSYTIKNLSTATGVLSLTGTSGLISSSTANCNVVVVDPVTTTVGIGSFTTFSVTITPFAPGAWSVGISIDNDDANENPYTFTISGTAGGTLRPEIEILDSSSNDIVNGGTVALHGSVSNVLLSDTFTINNLGNIQLNVSAASTGSDSNGASGISLSTPVGIAAPGNTTFGLTFTSSSSGAWSFVVTITNDDSDEGNFTFTVTGDAQATAAPEIAVHDPAATDIADGGSETLTGTGSALFARQYTVRNEGAQTLNLTNTGTEVLVSNMVNCTVTVTQPTTTALAPATGAATAVPFTLNITPGGGGTFSFEISISNNDPDESPFNWTFDGNSLNPGSGLIGGGGGSGCSATSAGSNSLLALLLGLLGLVAVIRPRRNHA